MMKNSTEQEKLKEEMFQFQVTSDMSSKETPIMTSPSLKKKEPEVELVQSIKFFKHLWFIIFLKHVFLISKHKIKFLLRCTQI